MTYCMERVENFWTRRRLGSFYFAITKVIEWDGATEYFVAPKVTQSRQLIAMEFICPNDEIKIHAEMFVRSHWPNINYRRFFSLLVLFADKNICIIALAGWIFIGNSRACFFLWSLLCVQSHLTTQWICNDMEENYAVQQIANREITQKRENDVNEASEQRVALWQIGEDGARSVTDNKF